MIVKLLQEHKINGNTYPKGTTVAVTRAVGMELCKDEIAVSNTDIPCKPKRKRITKSKK